MFEWLVEGDREVAFLRMVALGCVAVGAIVVIVALTVHGLK